MIIRSYHPSSSNLKECAYNTDTKIMRILFRSEYLYFFYDVPRRVFEYIKDGSPKGGRRFWSVLARAYQYRQINRDDDIGLSNIRVSIDRGLPDKLRAQKWLRWMMDNELRNGD